jgi:hypothetical protein
MRLARFAFQACAIDRSAISPLNKINNLRLIVGSDVIPIVAITYGHDPRSGPLSSISALEALAMSTWGSQVEGDDGRAPGI